jgi:carnitine O-acetyltransferase
MGTTRRTTHVPEAIGHPGITYEFAQTPKLKLGRTEVIRRASNESKAWAEAMLDPHAWTNPLKLKDLFSEAVSRTHPVLDMGR